MEENILPGTVGSLQNESQASVILGFNLKGTPPMKRKTLSSIFKVDIFLLSIPFHACSYICKSNLIARRCFFLVLLGQQISINSLSVTLAARFVRDKLQYLSTWVDGLYTLLPQQLWWLVKITVVPQQLTGPCLGIGWTTPPQHSWKFNRRRKWISIYFKLFHVFL